MNIVNEKKAISTIPVLEVYDADSSSEMPLVIILHGFLGQKEENAEFANSLAQDGYFVVLPDAFLHGEQKKEDYEQISMFKKVGRIDEIFLKTTDYINDIIAYYGKSRANTARIGLIGVSMGGCIIYSYLARQNKINVKAAVPIIATPYWYNHLTQAPIDIDMPEAGKFIKVDLLKTIKKIEPSNLLNNIKDTPLLMLNGEADRLIPIEDVRKTYTLIKNNYDNSDNIRFIEYRGHDHIANEEMFKEAANWIKRFL